MSQKENEDSLKISDLEFRISTLNKRIRQLEAEKKKEEEKRVFFSQVADFSNDWELWFSPEGKIKYCSPSCLDITGYSSKQITEAPSLEELLVYEDDRPAFNHYIGEVLSLMAINKSLTFRIVTGTRQVRWCEMTSRSVHDSYGKYLGIRASVRDVTRLCNTTGYIKQLSETIKLDKETKDKLAGELEGKEREIASYVLLLSQKNELIKYLEKNIGVLDGLHARDRKKKLVEMIDKIRNSTARVMDWELFKIQFENLYPDFFDSLNAAHKNLTKNETKLCALLKMNMSTKEIAGLLNISPKSTEVARVRLRKKLRLKRDQRLTSYLNNL